MNRYLALILLGLTTFSQVGFSQFNDLTHFSSVFDRDKDYRIFFPDSYVTAPTDSFPVVYFFHGWGGSHDQDPSALVNHDSVEIMVANSSAILVMLNGRSVDDNSRPYNIGDHEHVIYEAQFKDYFLEFVEHIDSTYRTLSNRENRATIGFSMGGFMSYFLAGKYPHMINTAVNVVGSPEFNVGYPDIHTLYSHRFNMGNLHGVKLRFHNSTTGELTYLNSEVNSGAIKEEGLDYLYKKYPGPHQFNEPNSNAIFQETYDWVLASFDNPTPKPERWNHIDLYSDFKVWNYEVSSNLSESGYIEMKGVTNNGMRIGTRIWMPDGPAISGITTEVKTAPIYEPNSSYTLLDYNQSNNSVSNKTITSDSKGRVSFTVSGDIHNVGIINENSPAEIVFVDYTVDGSKKFLEQGVQGAVQLKLFNRGGKDIHDLQIIISTNQDGVTINNSTAIISQLNSGDTIMVETEFEIIANYSAPADASPFSTRFNLEFIDNQSNKWFDEFDIPVFFDLLPFTGIVIDDGVKIKDEIFGVGNTNGIIDAGENVMLYAKTTRLRLYYDDPYVEKVGERLYDETLYAKWEADGTTLSSIIKIADDCPTGHVIKFMANWEYKDFDPIKRYVFWGEFEVTVGATTSSYSKKKIDIQIYPNPAEEFILVSNSSNLDGLNMEILNIAGQVVLQQNISNKQLNRVDLDSLTKGIYL